jgi:hypothetical protein
MEKIASGDSLVYSYVQGSTQSSACTCDADYRFEGVECIPCTNQMTCAGMGNVQVIPGFAAADGDVNRIFECSINRLWCPGGDAGVCNDGREGIQCGICEEDYTPGKDGKCTKCEGADSWPFILVCCIAVLGLFCFYHCIAKGDQGKGKATMSVLLVVIAGSQVIIATQMVGVFAAISVEWDEPFSTVLGIAKILTSFNLDILRLSCIARLTPSEQYLSRVFTVAIGVGCIITIFILHTIIFESAQFKRMLPKLVVALGALCMTLFISIVSTITAPLQCIKHPSGSWTVRTYPTILCGESSEFTQMLVVGCSATLVPLCFITAVSYIVWVFPKKMQRIDTKFVNLFGFLFVCYRIETYWFCLVIWFRNLTISLIPIIPNVIGQIIAFSIGILLMLIMVSRFVPWRAPLANFLDICIYASVLCINSLAAGFVTPDKKMMASICTAFIVFCFLLLIGAVGYGIYKRFLRPSKTYKYFISHHKAAAGAFARLLKMALLEKCSPSTQIFIDADNLTNLDLLFDTVASDVDTIVVIASAEFFKRPWCVGEITISHVHKVKTQAYYCEEFKPPSDEFIDDFMEQVTDFRALSENNISLQSVQAALRWFRNLPHTDLPLMVTAGRLDRLVKNIVAGTADNLDKEASMNSALTRKDAEIMIAADEGDFEATAIARILCKLLISHRRGDMIGQIKRAPEVLADLTHNNPSFKINNSIGLVVLVMTNGCFNTQNVIKTLYQASVVNTGLLPVVGSEAFRFPTEDFYESLSTRALQVLKEMGTPVAQNQVSRNMIVENVKTMFKRIAVLFESHASMKLLEAQSYEVMQKNQSVLCRGPKGVDSIIGGVKGVKRL